MSVYEFALVFNGPEDWPTEALERLFAVCQDVIPGKVAGVPDIGFVRAAPSLGEAIRSALADIDTAKLPGQVIRIEIHADELATA